MSKGSKGWTFVVSIQRIGDGRSDRLRLMPFVVGIGDQANARHALVESLDKESIRIEWESALDDGFAEAIGLQEGEIRQHG